MGGSLGKLKAAAHWLLDPAAGDDRPFAEDPEARKAMTAMGMTPPPAGPQVAGPAGPALVLWAWHVGAFHLFAALRTQWRVVSTRVGLRYEGLDYGVLDSTAARCAVVLDGPTWQALQVLELAGRKLLTQIHTTH